MTTSVLLLGIKVQIYSISMSQEQYFCLLQNQFKPVIALGRAETYKWYFTPLNSFFCQAISISRSTLVKYFDVEGFEPRTYLVRHPLILRLTMHIKVRTPIAYVSYSDTWRLELERAKARARRPGLNAEPAINKPDKPGLNLLQSPRAFESPNMSDQAQSQLRASLNIRL